MDASAIAKRHAETFNLLETEDVPEMGYVELSLEEKRELIGVGCTVRYNRKSYGHFEGKVLETCAETDRCFVRFEDEFGVRAYWLALDLLTLRLCAEAAQVESEAS